MCMSNLITQLANGGKVARQLFLAPRDQLPFPNDRALVRKLSVHDLVDEAVILFGLVDLVASLLPPLLTQKREPAIGAIGPRLGLDTRPTAISTLVINVMSVARTGSFCKSDRPTKPATRCPDTPSFVGRRSSAVLKNSIIVASAPITRSSERGSKSAHIGWSSASFSNHFSAL